MVQCCAIEPFRRIASSTVGTCTRRRRSGLTLAKETLGINNPNDGTLTRMPHGTTSETSTEPHGTLLSERRNQTKQPMPSKPASTTRKIIMNTRLAESATNDFTKDECSAHVDTTSELRMEIPTGRSRTPRTTRNTRRYTGRITLNATNQRHVPQRVGTTYVRNSPTGHANEESAAQKTNRPTKSGQVCINDGDGTANGKRT